jgi:uncharacterized membrane protein required for colicin V production
VDGFFGFDLLLIIILVVAALAEGLRGFGSAILDCAGLFAVLKVANAAYPAVAQRVEFVSSAVNNQAIVYAALFLLLSVLYLVCAHFCYNQMNISLGQCDHVFGVLVGCAVGIMLAHGVVRCVSLTDPTGHDNVPQYTNGMVSNEILEFTTVHNIITSFTTYAQNNREVPTG